MILNHRIDAMGIPRCTIHIMTVPIKVFESHHAIVHWFIEHIGGYILSISVSGAGHGFGVIQAALAIGGRKEQVLVDVVLDATHQSQGGRRLQIARIAIGDEVETRSTQVVQVIGIPFAISTLVIELPMR